ncbi:hypothetical protein [Paenibacillus popilliae]|uniref:Uncharacterized protein n=1 Tax=Paenibacillus popilliae ATCC 14706 TaxID=1212764 RepID=M9M2B4_PAEPP|nr:hypothetical protein [Paenibacillus popilliae]GAC41268.1 hypothetical protein PPOP_0618 [Paenibacillus popilliae ATCC 14706]
MKYHLMQPVMIVSDTLGYALPVGSLAYVTMIEPRGFFGTPYFIRVPSEQKEYWSPECDLEPAADWIAKKSDALMDFALATGNKALFEAQARQGAKRE